MQDGQRQADVAIIGLGRTLEVVLHIIGDGLDDLATRGFAEAAGGITILKLTDKNRLQRLANGFAWEAR